VPVKTVPITCPNCGSADLASLGMADYQCNHCGSFFLAKTPAAQAGAPPGPQPIRPRSSSAFPIVAGVFIATLMAGGVVVSLALRSTTPPPDPIPVYTPVQTPPPTPPPSIVGSARIGAQIEGTTRAGGKFWLIDYDNVGSSEIINPAVAVSLFDVNGARVAEQTGHSAIKRLRPGGRATILILVNDVPAYSRAQVEIVPPSTETYALPEETLAVTEYREKASVGSLRNMIGTVKNESSVAVRFVNVLAVGRDASNLPVSFAQGVTTKKEIEAGSDSGFSIPIGTFEVESPTRWDVIAVGAPR
jgi:hypothetical protein